MKLHTGVLVVLTALAGTTALAQDRQEQEEDLRQQQKNLKEQQRDLQKQQSDLEAKLEAARERLDEAAREVSELTTQLNLPVITEAFSWEGRPRAIIGVQVDGKSSARIEKVSPGGPAAEAGVRAGDVIIALNGEKIEGKDASREVVRQMRRVEPNSKVKVQVLRNGKPQEFLVTARPVRSVLAHPEPPVPPEPPDPPGFRTFLGSLRNELTGMEVATLTPELGEYFGTKKGVLVLRAPESDTYKLKDGDVILSIDGREPRSGSHATRILRSYQPGETINLKIMRQRKPVSLEVTAPESAVRRARVFLHSDSDEDPL